jgi:hypothetical protein
MSIIVLAVSLMIVSTLVSCENADPNYYKTTKINGITFVEINFGSDHPSWVPDDGIMYFEKEQYDLHASIVKLLAEKFNKREAFSAKDIEPFDQRQAELANNASKKKKLEDIAASMKNAQDLARVDPWAIMLTINNFYANYNENVNSLFFYETDQSVVKMRLAEMFQDPEKKSEFIMMNTMFPNSQFNIQEYLSSVGE